MRSFLSFGAVSVIMALAAFFIGDMRGASREREECTNEKLIEYKRGVDESRKSHEKHKDIDRDAIIKRLAALDGLRNNE